MSFDMHRCLKCSTIWSSNAIGTVINHLCPTCIPIMFPQTLCDAPADDLDPAAEAQLYGRDKPEKLLFPERYGELRDLGYADWEIAKRLGMTNLSLLRQLRRYEMEARPEFVAMCYEDRERQERRRRAA